MRWHAVYLQWALHSARTHRRTGRGSIQRDSSGEVGGGGGQKCVYQNWSDKIFRTLVFVFSHDGHLVSKGGVQGGGGLPQGCIRRGARGGLKGGGVWLGPPSCREAAGADRPALLGGGGGGKGQHTSILITPGIRINRRQRASLASFVIRATRMLWAVSAPPPKNRGMITIQGTLETKSTRNQVVR